jgi:lipopolysaccharide biosynthesis glycosyltransferase
MDMNIVYSTDSNYVRYMSVSLASLLYHTPKNLNLTIHILCQDVEESRKESILKLRDNIRKDTQINFYDINTEDFEQYMNISTYPGITLPAYFRLHLASILPKDIKTVLYLDGDTVINSSLEKLFETDLSNNYIAGALDINCRSFERCHKKYNLNENSYVNSGVLYMNLDKIRKDNIESSLDSFVKHSGKDVVYGDQDIFNLFFANKILTLPSEYNVHGTTFFNRNTYKKPIIIHHVLKAWNYGQKTYYQGKYFKFLRMTDYKFPSPIKEFSYRFSSGFIAFFKFFKPKHFFNFETWYEIYKFIFKKNS